MFSGWCLLAMLKELPVKALMSWKLEFSHSEDGRVCADAEGQG
jgi:hypothetical protein